MRLWTVQPVSVWEELRAQGTLRADPTGEVFFQDFHDSYDWMRGQIRRRLPGYGGGHPWWAYEHRPDLRRRPVAGPGRFVRLELSLPPDRVLLSDYAGWHSVLNHWYLPQAVGAQEREHEEAAWEEELRRHGLDAPRSGPLPEPWHSRNPGIPG